MGLQVALTDVSPGMPDKAEPKSFDKPVGLPGFADLLVQSYSPTKVLATLVPGLSSYNVRNSVYDYLQELEMRGEEDAFRDLLSLLPNIDPMAKHMGIPKTLPHKHKVLEILKRLRIFERRSPRGVLSDIRNIEDDESRLAGITKYDDMVVLAWKTCERVEYMLKMLIVFYGGFCFRQAFTDYFINDAVPGDETSDDGAAKGDVSEIPDALAANLVNSIADQALRNSLEHFFKKRMAVDMGKRIAYLMKLDDYTKQSSAFLGVFGRQSIFDPLQEAEPHEPMAPTKRRSRRAVRVLSRLEERPSSKLMKLLLDEIRNLRNPLPHDKDGRPATEALITPEGLRDHLMKLFRAIRRLKTAGDRISLFPTAGHLVQKYDRLNLGAQLELRSEQDATFHIPCEDLSSFRVGAEYFCWKPSALHPWSQRSVLVLKRIR